MQVKQRDRLPLDYESPPGRKTHESSDRAIVFGVFRRIGFAVGCGLLVAGIRAPSSDRDGPVIAGFGAAMVGLTVPWPRHR